MARDWLQHQDLFFIFYFFSQQTQHSAHDLLDKLCLRPNVQMSECVGCKHDTRTKELMHIAKLKEPLILCWPWLTKSITFGNSIAPLHLVV